MSEILIVDQEKNGVISPLACNYIEEGEGAESGNPSPGEISRQIKRLHTKHTRIHRHLKYVGIGEKVLELFIDFCQWHRDHKRETYTFLDNVQ